MVDPFGFFNVKYNVKYNCGKLGKGEEGRN